LSHPKQTFLNRDRFGSHSTRLEPKTLATEYIFANPPSAGFLTRNSYYVSYTADDFYEIVIDPTLSADDQRAIKFENERRRRGKKVTDAIAQYMHQMETLGNIQEQANLFHQALPPKQPPEVLSRAPSVQFNEIRNFLFGNRLVLALGTMDFPMPEHTLYNYILMQGGIPLEADEWRAFLRVCHDTENLFRYIC